MGVRAVFIDQEIPCTGHKKREPVLAPGTCHWEWYENDPNGVNGALNFVCPCGCGEVDFIFVKVGPVQSQRTWGWDGNRESPTLTSSISRIGAACKWHGFLIKGEFVNA